MNSLSIKTLSRITGATYLLMIPFGIVGILYVTNTIFVVGDIVATIDKIKVNISMVHLSVLASLVVQLLQIFLALLLYRLFNHVNKAAAVLMVAFIIPAVSIAMLNEIFLLTAVELVSNATYLTSFTVAHIQGLVQLLFGMHQAGVMVAQILWGLWLLPMGYLVYKSGFVPRVIGVLLMIGCFGYVADSVFYILSLDIGFSLSEFTFLGEVLLPLWLLVKASDVSKKYSNRTSLTQSV